MVRRRVCLNPTQTQSADLNDYYKYACPILKTLSSQSIDMKPLIISIPNFAKIEQRYALDILLGEFLGLAFEVDTYDGDYIEITDINDSKKLTLDTSFFKKAHGSWLKNNSMPTLPLNLWNPSDDSIDANLVHQTLPILYGKPGIIKKGSHWHINVDIFGSAFFMLSRYEELIVSDRDGHNRFPATASVAYKANFLDRPVINEYLEILWACLSQLWPGLQRKERQFRKLISCDVDHPMDHAGYSLKRTILRVGARLLRDKKPKLALYDGLNYGFKKFGLDCFDEYRNNIDWIMKVNDQVGNKVAFYFIPIQTDKEREDPNDVRNPKVSALLKHIVDSGHEVGFHPGYKTYKDPENFQRSADALHEACQNESIRSSGLGGRQHYLMYDISQTPQLWEEYGFLYESSLSFADQAGFRCGVCYEYSMYDLVGRKKMALKQRPLVAMECTIIAKGYESLGCGDEAQSRFQHLKSACQLFNGDYTLLWHNSYLYSKKLRKLYESSIK